MGKRIKRNFDPHWITARFGGGVCSELGCNELIRKGDSCFYFPVTRAIFATRCGHAHAASADFEAHRFDEANNGVM